MKIKFKDEQSRHEFRQCDNLNKDIEFKIGNEPHEVIQNEHGWYLSNDGLKIIINGFYAFISSREMKYFDIVEDSINPMDSIEALWALWNDVQEKKAAFERSLELYHAEYNRMFR